MKQFDDEKIKKAITMLLEAVGEDPTREGLIDTPKRVAKFYNEALEGMKYTDDELVAMFDKQFALPTSNNMVCVRNIPLFSFCEHHWALMYNMRATIAYIPKDRVIGLSKISRIADMVAKRLQLQERICESIAYILKEILKTNTVAVIIEGEHSCVAARGIKKIGSPTRTEVVSGDFCSNPIMMQRLYSQI